MNSTPEFQLVVTRRRLLGDTGLGIGSTALASLMDPSLLAASGTLRTQFNGLPDLPHFAPRAKRVIYLFQSGAPSQIDLFDHKPRLQELHGSELPDSVRRGQRLTEMTHRQNSFPCVGSTFRFAPHGPDGTWMSEMLPHTASIAGEICVIRSVNTEAINHDPGITYINTGTQQLGKASMGSWLSYGLGNESQDLPSYVVMLSQGTGLKVSQPLFSRLWSSGFLPSTHQGVRFRSGRDPILYLSDPPGLHKSSRRRILDGIARLNAMKAEQSGDPEIQTRIAQYEMAFRMQTSVPELMDMSDETEQTFDLYGPYSRQPGTYAANCLLARRLAERGVRFVQLFHRGWDHHGNLPNAMRGQCGDTDQSSAALIKDLRQRGMLDETLVIWGGEFGRTVYCQGELTAKTYGRDHHGRCFSMWMAGGGVQGGISYGETDDYSYNVVKDPVHIHDLNATILDCLGIDHERFTFKYQGLDQRLTGVENPRVVREILV